MKPFSGVQKLLWERFLSLLSEVPRAPTVHKKVPVWEHHFTGLLYLFGKDFFTVTFFLQ